MELVCANQVSYEELINEQIDIVIAACGVESRSRHLLETVRFHAKRKIAIIFKDISGSSSLDNNRQVFEKEGFECYELPLESSEELTHLLKKISIDPVFENIKLVVDYSSMATIWYGTIISFYALHELYCKKLTVYFCYTPGNFVPRKSFKPSNDDLYPLISHNNSKTNQKPIALIVGLGQNGAKADFLCNFFKPVEVHFFVPNPAFDERHTQMLKESNKKLFTELKSTQIHHYPANNIEEIDSKLRGLCLNLRLKYRVILVSLGPKTFSLASFLLNSRYPDIEIWHISGVDYNYDLQAADMPIVYKAVLTSEEDDF
jgi:hypothetical protein